MKKNLSSIIFFALALLSLPLSFSCKDAGCNKETSSTRELPVVNESTTDLLLTWLDAKGERHVEVSVTDVLRRTSLEKEAVRLVFSKQTEGSKEGAVYLVNFNEKDEVTKGFRLKSSSVFEFDELVQKRKDAYLAKSNQLPDASSEEGSQPGGDELLVGAESKSLTVVTVYGSAFCEPCHKAIRYLQSKNIRYIEKDIEKDKAAFSEMQKKVKAAGLPLGSIPVLDVRGHILLGFSEKKIDEALGKAL